MDGDLVFPSKYLKGEDIKGKEITVTMAGAEIEELGDEKKMVVYFQGKDRGVVLNKTNYHAIRELYGKDTDEWVGKEVILFTMVGTMNGKTGPWIRIKGPRNGEMDDAVPF